MSPDSIVLLASKAPINKTLPPEPTTSKELLTWVATKTWVIVLLVPPDAGKLIASLFLQVCVFAESVVKSHLEAATCCLA